MAEAGWYPDAEVRLLGWSVLSVLFRQRVLVLETIGRKSGRRRRTTVAYRDLAGEIVVVGGAGGQSRPPDWVANLAAHPAVGVTRQRRAYMASARLLAGAERASAWERLASEWPIISKYQERAGYPIPVCRQGGT